MTSLILKKKKSHEGGMLLEEPLFTKDVQSIHRIDTNYYNYYNFFSLVCLQGTTSIWSVKYDSVWRTWRRWWRGKYRTNQAASLLTIHTSDMRLHLQPCPGRTKRVTGSHYQLCQEGAQQHLLKWNQEVPSRSIENLSLDMAALLGATGSMPHHHILPPFLLLFNTWGQS